MDSYKEVNFEKYCKTCKNEKLEEFKDPCNECLTIACREETEKPECWEEKE